jgi:hypothetical protein
MAFLSTSLLSVHRGYLTVAQDGGLEVAQEPPSDSNGHKYLQKYVLLRSVTFAYML